MGRAYERTAIITGADSGRTARGMTADVTSNEDLGGLDMARAPMIASRSIKREMPPDDLLGTPLHLAVSDRNVVTGQTLNVDGGNGVV